MNYYKRHIGDYAKKAGHLSLLEHGVYTLLLDAYYDREQAPTRAEAVRISRCRTDEELAALDAVLSDFFDLKDGRYVQTRVEEEFVKAEAQARANQENGKRGGRPRKPKGKRTETHSVSDANPSDSENNPNPLIHQSTNPEKQKLVRKRTKPATTALPEGFGISDRVSRWAVAKGFHELDRHLEFFVGKARAKGYVYADWDEALMCAIRDDWAEVRSGRSRNGVTPPQQQSKTLTAIQKLQAMKNGQVDSERDHGRVEQAALPGT